MGWATATENLSDEARDTREYTQVLGGIQRGSFDIPGRYPGFPVPGKHKQMVARMPMRFVVFAWVAAVTAVRFQPPPPTAKGRVLVTPPVQETPPPVPPLERQERMEIQGLNLCILLPPSSCLLTWRTSSTMSLVTWKSLSVPMPTKGKKGARDRILSDVSGWACAGETGCVALMGPSGCGKTTLLSIVAGHAPCPSGASLTLDGAAYGPTTSAQIGFVPQTERLFATLTVRETFALHARLRGSRAVAPERIERLQNELGLSDVLDSVVGDPAAIRRRGLSGGERKRLAVGLELLHTPPLLILDEPTSGLDSHAALGVATALRLLGQKQAVVCSVHQPSSAVLGCFGTLGLLSSTGHSLYFGPTGDAPGHWSSQGRPVPPLTAAAEHYIDLAFELSRQADAAAAAFVARPPEDPHAARRVSVALPPRPSLGVQFSALLWRAHTNNMRNPAFMRAMASRSVAMALVVGSLYSDVGLTQRGVQDRTGALYFILVNQVMTTRRLHEVTLPVTQAVTQAVTHPGQPGDDHHLVAPHLHRRVQRREARARPRPLLPPSILPLA